MADPYSPFTLGEAATSVVAADPDLAAFGRTSALADELLRMARSGGDTTALADELIAMARTALPEVSRATEAAQVMEAAITTEGLLGKLAAVAPMAAGVLQALHRGADGEAVAAQLAPSALAAMGANSALPATLGDIGAVGIPSIADATAAGAGAGTLGAAGAAVPGLDRIAGAAGGLDAAGLPTPAALADVATPAFGAVGGAQGRVPSFDPSGFTPASGVDAHVGSRPGQAGRAAPTQARARDVTAPASRAPALRGDAPAPLSHAARQLLATLSGQPRLLEIDTALPGAFLVERFEGLEAVCAPFKFEIDCLSLSAFLDTRALLGQPIDLRLRQADESQRHWHGLCTAVAPLGSDGGYARYRLTLEPWTALLTLRRNALIFQDLDVHGVLERVFADYPQAAWRFDVTQPLPKRAITTQYRESDWDFVVRLLAEAGLAWRFEHAQGEASDDHAATHTLVIFDRQAEPPTATPATLRFHRVDATESRDAITHFTQQRQAVPDAVATASWQADQVEAFSASADAAPAGPHLPRREVYTVPRAGRFAQRDHAQQAAELRLDALRLPQHLHAGAGSSRGLQAGAAFTLRQHPDLDGRRFVPLAVEHVAANNLGSGILALLDDSGLEHGSYRNRFLAVPAETAIVPLARPKPLAPGAQTARVVGLPDAANTVSRDHQVRIQFAWQRGAAPQAGGLNDTGSSSHPDGHAPGDHTSGTWVRVAEWLAGPNWGSHALPRIGAEVLVEFLHADIDQPVVSGQLFNGAVAPPFALSDASNHIGTLSGLHTQSLDGNGTQQWLVDDAPGQLRQRLHTSLADSRLELGYLIDHHNGQRGALRGQGFDLATLGWANLQAGQGVLLSSTARDDARSTQFDVAEAVSQLRGAEQTAQALSDAAGQHRVLALTANAEQTALIAALDVEQDGKYSGPVNGQAATKPTGGSRDGGAAVERFARPLLFVESPNSVAATTPASALAFAGANLHLTAQDDAHLVAGQTVAAVSGGPAAVFAQRGPIRTIAAHGPVSLQAHAGPLELLADQSVTVTATDDRIDVLANQKIVLQAGQTQVTLEGGDITFACPGEFTVKAGQQPFRGGARAAAVLPALPNGDIKHWIGLHYLDPDTSEGIDGAEYEIHFKDGQVIEGALDKQGEAQHDNVDNKPVAKVVYKPRPPDADKPPPVLEELLIQDDAQGSAG